MTSSRRLWSLPWVLALVGLAVPMIGSGFIGWPFVVGWLVLCCLSGGSRIGAGRQADQAAARVQCPILEECWRPSFVRSLKPELTWVSGPGASRGWS